MDFSKKSLDAFSRSGYPNKRFLTGRFLRAIAEHAVRIDLVTTGYHWLMRVMTSH